MSQSAVVTVTFVLTGAYAGRTITLGSLPYPFKEGKLSLTGPAEEVALHARFMERNWQAFPEGHERLKEPENGQREIQSGAQQPNGQADLHGDGEPGGSGAGPGVAGPVDGGSAGGGEAGNPGAEAVRGDGPAPELNTKLQKAVMDLDPADDSHWTKEGKPAITAVEKLYGSAGITRADVEAVAPGFKRKAA